MVRAIGTGAGLALHRIGFERLEQAYSHWANACKLHLTPEISFLAYRNYESIEDEIARLLRINDSPVWSAGRYRGG
ncbi:hypothetical protein [Brevibacillus reuszeri]|uniref:hypothetical protein n=1 Tax=Brevibacillus reuszeri TaxID=54915 RepID=UPI0028A01342|nr:hypothetical protein [Brevibacillus reuszeri]